ncbi:MAG: biotin--[acetyl-CoA-carboxylase] ligase [Bacillota bacterium]
MTPSRPPQTRAAFQRAGPPNLAHRLAEFQALRRASTGNPESSPEPAWISEPTLSHVPGAPSCKHRQPQHRQEERRRLVAPYSALAYLGLGSNLGDRRRNMADAVRMLSESGHARVERVSSLYETEPVGYAEQGPFLNAVAEIVCDLDPSRLLSLCQDIEVRLGRKRTVRWGPRTIDIDILLYFGGRPAGGESPAEPGAIGVQVRGDREKTPAGLTIEPSPGRLEIPHPRMWQRGFVIIPLAEIAPHVAAPDGRSVKDLARDPVMQRGVFLHATGSWWKRADEGGTDRGSGGARHVRAQGPVFLGREVQRFAEVDSTNAVARRMAEAGAPEGTCVVAETQTAGRGRMGRTWHSPPGGLWLSVVLRPTVAPRDVGKLALVTGVAVTEAIRKATSLPAKMKWPNDVVVRGRKVSGILVEGRWRGEAVDYIVEGIGINVAVDIAGLPQDIQATAGTLVPPCGQGALALRERLLALVLEELGVLYRRFLSGRFLGILEKARLYSDTLGREVEAACPGGPVLGTAVDIDADGALVIRTSSGDVRMVSGDVSVRSAGGGYSG